MLEVYRGSISSLYKQEWITIDCMSYGCDTMLICYKVNLFHLLQKVVDDLV